MAEKGCYLGAPQVFRLSQACLIVKEGLGATPYLVGSALTTPDFRDVDVRCIFDDEKYDALFGRGHQDSSSFWSLLCVGVSAMLRDATGLPVDFQVQRRSDVKESDWSKYRMALAFHVNAGEQTPPWRGLGKFAGD